jgi:hypothetical protein
MTVAELLLQFKKKQNGLSKFTTSRPVCIRLILTGAERTGNYVYVMLFIRPLQKVLKY